METLVLLHGFLGSPADWSFLLKVFPHSPHLNFDLFKQGGFKPEDGLESAGKKVNDLALAGVSPKILIGYSLGARIGLHALIDQPKLWKGAVLISSHPGISSEEERKSRLENDGKWAKRFLNEPWEELISSWNSQPVFSTKSCERPESEYSRSALARSLTGWSLGNQQDLHFKVAELDLPILWITGEDDKKFTTIAKSVKLSHPLSRQKEISRAAHRAPWDNQPEFIAELNCFINSINQRMDHVGRSNRYVARDQDVSRH